MSTKVINSEAVSMDSSSIDPFATEAVDAGRSRSNLVPSLPPTVEGRSSWFREIAADELLAVRQLAALGPSIGRLEEPFASLITGEVDAARLVRSQRSMEIVCLDRSQAGTRFEYMTVPQLLAHQVNTRPLELPGNQLIEWRLRLLAKAGLIGLPEVPLRPLGREVTEYTNAAYHGAKLLFGCRWYLEPGEPVPYSAGFIQTWCGISYAKAASARDYLRRHVLHVVGTAACGRPKEMQMFLPLGLDT